MIVTHLVNLVGDEHEAVLHAELHDLLLVLNWKPGRHVVINRKDESAGFAA
jgi:hypothetical protein